ncbi:unnamed protein product [Meloidogyne enterolobii]|uniref:Uncharacterized protein n=1 Tax=Meloidogyne enterolobii TaxID=390850 RepID=A0ACB0YAJ5_MELEN
MFANIAAFSIVVLQLLGQLNITGAVSVGHWNHSLQEGKVTLAKGSRVAAGREDFGQYMRSSPNACIIDTLKMVGKDYILLYSKYKDKEAKGCTVDFLTDLENEIALSAALVNFDGIGFCLNNGDINSNVLPFAYSLTNEEVKKFHNGPLFADGDCPGCYGGCVKKTGLEFRWASYEARGKEYVLLSANPIATKLVQTEIKLWYMKEKAIRINSVLTINQKDPKFHISSPINEPNIKDQKSICMNNLKENVLSPSTWEIVGTRPDPIMTRLLVFHLLPQTASRKMTMKVEDLVTGNKKYVVKKEHPVGPECNEVAILFDKRNYRLLTVSPITATSKPTSPAELPTQGLPIMQQKTAPSPKVSTKSPSKTTVTKAKTKRTSTTKDSSETLLIVVMIVVVVIILVAIGIGIAVYFVSRKDSGKKEKGAARPNK